MGEHGADGHKIPGFFPVDGRGGKEMLQDRDFGEERNSDGLFHLAFLMPHGQNLFLAGEQVAVAGKLVDLGR